MSHPFLPFLLAGSSEDPASALLAVIGSRDSVPEGVRAAFAVNGIENERSKRRRAETKIARELHELSHSGLLKYETDADKKLLAEKAPAVKALLDSFKHAGSAGGAGTSAGTSTTGGSSGPRGRSGSP